MTKHRYHFASIESPTQFNLEKHLSKAGFKSTKKINKANFSDQNLILDERFTEILEHKHRLAELSEKHCPEIMPLTFYIDDSNYREVIQTIEQQYPNLVWILKPALLNNAEGIKIFTNPTAIKQHYQQGHRFSGEHVLQQYITEPHLLNDHKYTFRMFVIISNFAGVYLYHHGYFNVSREAYQANDYSELGPHLTNEHLHADHSPNVWQIPTTRCPNFETIYEQMHEQVERVISGLNNEAPTLFTNHACAQAFSLFGFDFILDKNLKLWLLEINHAPCFPKDENHPLQEHLYKEFWETIISSFVIPITENRKPEIMQNKPLDLIHQTAGL